MVARQPLATVREARYGYAVANMGSNPHSSLIVFYKNFFPEKARFSLFRQRILI
jgi:hypothetical protein